MAVEGKRVRDDVVLPPIVTPSTDGFCDEKSLPTDGSCQQHSIVELLRLSCLRCFDSACASRGDLVGAALKVWRSRLVSPAASPPEAQKAGHHCLPAVRAAAIVLLHLQPGFRARMKGSSADLLAAEELSEADNDMLAVRPFPFAHQFSELYQRFRPANLEGDCMDDKYAKLGDAVGPADLAQRRHERTSLVPLVDAAVSRCSAASEDNHLVQRCLSRRHRSYIVGGGRSDVRRPEVGWPLPSWRCPRNETPLVGQKYDTQSWRSCSSARGSAGQNVAATLRCAAVAAGEALRVMPGSTVLEWGSGCGWMLTWLSTLFGARGYGIDASEPAIEWSRRFSPGSFCLWGDADLRWIADSSFDHVVSYWALYHVAPLSRQCAIARQLLAKLRPGGRAWFGGNDPWGLSWATRLSERQWTRCLRGRWASLDSASFRVEFVHDRAFLRADLDDFGERPGDFLLFTPAFSVFVERLVGTA